MDSGKGEMCSRVKEDGGQTAFLFFFSFFWFFKGQSNK